jgi:O-Antigen ligase
MSTSSKGSSKLNSTTSALFLFLMFFLVFLPSGTLFGVNVKVIALGTFLAVFALDVITGAEILRLSHIMFLMSVGTFLGLWTLIGLLNAGTDSSQVLYELRDVASTIFIAWLGILLIREEIVKAESLITSVIYAVFALAVMKIVLVTAPFIFAADIIEGIQSVFGAGSLLSGDIAFGIFRMQFSSDILAPFAIFALLTPSVSGVRFGRIFTSVILFIVLASGFIAFSRYIWFLFAVAIIAAMILERNFKMSAILAVAVLLIGVSLYDFFDAAFVVRFQSEGAAISDDLRVEQSKALIDQFKIHPILGAGLGASAKAVIRHDTLFYSYELQWLAFLMQFGMVGVCGLALLVGMSARDLVMSRHAGKLLITLLFLLWLASGFTNPYLTTSFAGVTFALFMAIFHRMRNSSLTIQPEAMPLEVSPQG